MVGTGLRAKAADPAGGSAPSAPVVASTQMELLKGEAAVQTSNFSKCLDLSPGAGTGSRPVCKRCTQVEELLQQVAELQEMMRRQCNIRETEKELHSWFQVQSAMNPQPSSQKLPHQHTQKGGGVYNAKEWKLAMARISRRKRLPLKPEMALQNHFTALQIEEQRPVTSEETLELSKAS